MKNIALSLSLSPLSLAYRDLIVYLRNEIDFEREYDSECDDIS